MNNDDFPNLRLSEEDLKTMSRIELSRERRKIVYDLMDAGITDRNEIAERIITTAQYASDIKQKYINGEPREIPLTTKENAFAMMKNGERCIDYIAGGAGSTNAVISHYLLEFCRNTGTDRSEFYKITIKNRDLDKIREEVEKYGHDPYENGDRHLCSSCIYRGKFEGKRCCEYILINAFGKMRGCPPSACTRYICGEKIKSTEGNLEFKHAIGDWSKS